MASVEPDELRERLEGFLSERLGHRVGVSELTQLPGGASRQTWAFHLTEGGEEGRSRRLILQRDPPSARAASEGARSRRVEFELLRRAGEAGVPVPRVLWIGDADELGAPGFVMELVEGETIARRILRDETYAEARERLAAQCGAAVARIHTLEVADLPGFDPPESNPALGVLEQYRSILDGFGEPLPGLELGARWLERRAPAAPRVGFVHGDFRLGNLIVGPDGLRAVIDWELAHLGDPWEDLGWICCRVWRFGGPGEVGGFGRREDLYRAYEEAAGTPVDRDAVRWWETLSSFKWGVMCLMQFSRHRPGQNRSHEHAAIGRRIAETEHDLLSLIREDG